MIELRHIHDHGWRCYVLGRRVHHGSGGAILAAVAWKLRRRRLAAALAIWALTDWRDFPFTDNHNH